MAIDLVQELTSLRRGILTMGGSVEQRVREAISGLIDHDQAAALHARRNDHEINRLELEIEEECLRILALSHPVARDLRLVLSVMRINTNFERIGDLAKSIAKRALDLHEQGYYGIPDPLRLMAAEATRMLSDSITALADGDADLARQVRSADDRVDDLQKEIFAWARHEIPDHIEHTEAVIDVMSIARKLERIGDIATNIAEDVIFMSEGSLVRHSR